MTKMTSSVFEKNHEYSRLNTITTEHEYTPNLKNFSLVASFALRREKETGQVPYLENCLDNFSRKNTSSSYTVTLFSQ